MFNCFYSLSLFRSDLCDLSYARLLHILLNYFGFGFGTSQGCAFTMSNHIYGQIPANQPTRGVIRHFQAISPKSGNLIYSKPINVFKLELCAAAAAPPLPTFC